MSVGKAKDAEIWDYERNFDGALKTENAPLDPIAEIERLAKELTNLQTKMKARVHEHQPIAADDRIVSAVTKEVKEAYGQGHDDGYRMAIHDVEIWLRSIGKSPGGYQIRLLANEISTGNWRKK